MAVVIVSGFVHEMPRLFEIPKTVFQGLLKTDFRVAALVAPSFLAEFRLSVIAGLSPCSGILDLITLLKWLLE
jgi:hypothetical protein